jgi:hypothetical protein
MLLCNQHNETATLCAIAWFSRRNAAHPYEASSNGTARLMAATVPTFMMLPFRWGCMRRAAACVHSHAPRQLTCSQPRPACESTLLM